MPQLLVMFLYVACPSLTACESAGADVTARDRLRPTLTMDVASGNALQEDEANQIVN